MIKKILELLACPSCHNPLDITVLDRQEKGTVYEGLLTCSCGLWYPITHGIPRLFVPGLLRPDDRLFLERWSSQISGLRPLLPEDKQIKWPNQTQVQRTFGHKWMRQAWWGIEGDSAKVMEEWLLPRYGWKSKNEYVKYMASKRLVLDAGCGLGREALRMAEANPNLLVLGLELSECVDEAARHARTKAVHNTFFVQADLMEPPFKNGIFDFIMSEGVLHHTPDTRQAFLSLVNLLAQRGEIAFYVYRKKAPIREFVDDYVREQIQSLSPDEAWRLMEPLTKLGKALSDLNVEVKVPEDVTVLGIWGGHYNLQRLIYYTMFKCYWNNRLTFDENVLVNFDWYYPKYVWRHTSEEIKKWCKDANLFIIHFHEEESGITMRAQQHF